MGPNDWGRTACLLAFALKAEAIVVESNYGGDLGRQVLSQAWEQLRREGSMNGGLMPRVFEVTAKLGKRLRAEPMAQLYEQGMVHDVGTHVALEDQMVTWVVGMDAAAHGLTELAAPDQLAAVAGHIQRRPRRPPITVSVIHALRAAVVRKPWPTSSVPSGPGVSMPFGLTPFGNSLRSSTVWRRAARFYALVRALFQNRRHGQRYPLADPAVSMPFQRAMF
ncbi:hypothetical protein [Streptomyces mirabilis]|uniref:hypothetical protein n=1 Tax=Streptomyces mirabilis TaxID=68239 RepID=UPI002254FE3F|nr:hypothetical protein [Streptomyces mirabilis]MCX4429649.1 hypothetical protein [Streptomyces mirabilis]